ncbi:hypothetical protein CB1_000249004 [Camelus ferus]|nr:hypothetical protein CB1_000249004 [Camelus ferus]
MAATTALAIPLLAGKARGAQLAGTLQGSRVPVTWRVAKMFRDPAVELAQSLKTWTWISTDQHGERFNAWRGACGLHRSNSFGERMRVCAERPDAVQPGTGPAAVLQQVPAGVAASQGRQRTSQTGSEPRAPRSWSPSLGAWQRLHQSAWGHRS